MFENKYIDKYILYDIINIEERRKEKRKMYFKLNYTITKSLNNNETICEFSEEALDELMKRGLYMGILPQLEIQRAMESLRIKFDSVELFSDNDDWYENGEFLASFKFNENNQLIIEEDDETDKIFKK